MKSQLEVFISKGNHIQRESFQLPDVDPNDFDPSKDMKTMFNYVDEKTGDCVKVWVTTTPTKEEETSLIEGGKWGFSAMPAKP